MLLKFAFMSCSVLYALTEMFKSSLPESKHFDHYKLYIKFDINA